jgi:integrase
MALVKRGKVYHSVLHENGKPVWRSLETGDRIEAGRLEAERRDALKSRSRGGDISWSEFKRTYVRWAAGEKDPNTLTTEKLAFKHLDDYVHLSKFSDMSPGVLSGLKAHLKGQGLGVAIRNRRIRALKTIMRWGEAQGYGKPQLWRIVKKDPEAKGRLIFYTPEEFSRIVERAPEPYRTCAILGARAGLRIGESCHLRWEDVNWGLGKVHIISKPCDCRECKLRGGVWHPKGEKERWVPLDQAQLLPHLAKRRKPEGWVIAEDGWRPTQGVVMTLITRQIKSLGLSGSSHTFRHTFASWLVQAGVPLYDVGKLLGHSDFKSTQIYAHLAPHNYEAAVAKLPAC